MTYIAAPNRFLILRRRVVGRRTVLAVGGEVDLATAAQLHDAIDEALDEGAHELWLDLGPTTFMDSTGLHVVFKARARAEELGRRFAVVCPDGPVRRLFDITGYAERLPIYDDLTTAHRLV